jgi:restriction system protein
MGRRRSVSSYAIGYALGGGRRRRSSSSGSAGTGLLVLGCLVLAAAWYAWDWITKHPVPAAIGIAAVVGLLLLWRRNRIAVPSVRVDTIEGFLALSPSGFEHEVANLLRSLGYRDVHVSGGAGDLSIDVRGVAADGRPVLIQCKRYAPDRRIGSPEIQQLYGMATLHVPGAQIVFITTSGFTAAALDIARKAGVETIDGPQLCAIARRVNEALARQAAQAAGASGDGSGSAAG